MTTYKQGDVVLAPFPFTDQRGSKQRPAVVLSGVSYNRSHPDIILAPITSQITNTADEVILADWEPARLLKPSAVKPIVSSFEISLIRRKLGELSGADLKRVRAMFVRVFELAGLPVSMPPEGAVRIELVEGVPLFRASTVVQNRIERLLTKQQKRKLDAEETKELDLYEEVDDYLSFLNRLVRNLISKQKT